MSETYADDETILLSPKGTLNIEKNFGNKSAPVKITQDTIDNYAFVLNAYKCSTNKIINASALLLSICRPSGTSCIQHALDGSD